VKEGEKFDIKILTYAFWNQKNKLRNGFIVGKTIAPPYKLKLSYNVSKRKS